MRSSTTVDRSGDDPDAAAHDLPLVERFAAAGKHVLLEKPLEADTARAEAVVGVRARA
jgi:predicted dehydrogenase